MLDFKLMFTIPAAAAAAALSATALSAAASPAPTVSSPASASAVKPVSTTVRYQRPVIFSLKVSDGTRMVVERQDGPTWTEVRATTARKGLARAVVRPTRQQTLRARTAAGVVLAAKTVRVHAGLTAKVSKARRFGVTRISGRLMPAAPGRTVRIEQQRQDKWVSVRSVRVAADGTYVAGYKPPTGQRGRLRVTFRGDRSNLSRTRVAGRPVVGLRFRSALASWYGPGFFGQRTGCGQVYSATIVGVAHKSLPCGTALAVRYNGRVVVGRVIDRGPYSGDREFDLSYAMKSQLGFGGVGTVGVAIVP